jgi:hypothetical protein
MNLIGITHNLNHLLTDEGILSIGYDSKYSLIEYNEKNLKIGLKILFENVEHLFSIGEIDKIEYCGTPRKILSSLLEIFKVKNPFKIISEWEIKYGNISNILYENYELRDIRLKVYESILPIYDIIGGQILDENIVSNAWNYLTNKIKSAYDCLSNDFVYCLMEGIRSVSLSAVGTATLTAVSMVPALGQVPIAVIFGSLLAWDLYKMASGKYEWSIFDIIVDIVSVLLPALGKAVQVAFKGVRSITDIARLSSKGGVYKKVYDLIVNNLPKLSKIIKDSMKWLTDKTKISFFKKMGDYSVKSLNKMVSRLKSGATPISSSSIKSLTSSEKKIYDNLVTAWKENQRVLGKSNLSPGEGTRNRLMTNAKELNKKTPSQSLYRPNLGKELPSKGKIITAGGSSFVLTAAFCAAFGLDPVSCEERAEKYPEEFIDALDFTIGDDYMETETQPKKYKYKEW